MPENSSCEVAASIARNSGVILSHLSILFFDILSFVVLGNYIWILIHLKSVHRNIRSINFTIALGYLLRNIYTTYRSGYKIYLTIFATNLCLFEEETIKCSIESILGRAPVNLALIGSNAAVAERFLATLFYRNYERYNYFLISFAIGAFPWVYQFIAVPPTVLDAIKKNSTTTVYCNSVTSIGINISVFISNMVITTMAALVVSMIIIVVNHRIKKFGAQNSGGRHINVEFQRKENLEHTKIIAAQIVGLLLTYFLNAFIALFISSPIISTSMVIHKELGTLCFPIYASIHVFLALIVSPTLRTKFFSTKLMKKLMGCCNLQKCLHSQIVPLASPEDYFRYYQTQWK